MSRARRRLAAWWRQIDTPSDWLSFTRLLLAPALWMPALLRKPKVVSAGVVVSAATDVLDGTLARATGNRSEFGKQLDTVADMAIILSAPGWLALLYPEVLHRRKSPLLALGGAAGILLTIEWRRYQKVAALHIDSARAAAVVAHLYALNLFVRGRDSNLLFSGFVLLAAGAGIETLYVIVSRETLNDLSETPLLDALFDASGIANPVDRSPFHDPARRAGRDASVAN
jgi:phosphatidylglycerophosphate synthase